MSGIAERPVVAALQDDEIERRAARTEALVRRWLTQAAASPALV